MQISRYAFIVKGPGYFPEEHTAEICSKYFSTKVVGVSNYEAAALAIKGLIANDVQLIELCGGFTQTEVDELRKLADDRAHIDVVR